MPDVCVVFPFNILLSLPIAIVLINTACRPRTLCTRSCRMWTAARWAVIGPAVSTILTSDWLSRTWSRSGSPASRRSSTTSSSPSSSCPTCSPGIKLSTESRRNFHYMRKGPNCEDFVHTFTMYWQHNNICHLDGKISTWISFTFSHLTFQHF